MSGRCSLSITSDSLANDAEGVCTSMPVNVAVALTSAGAARQTKPGQHGRAEHARNLTGWN
jgi:hypothetical protein